MKEKYIVDSISIKSPCSQKWDEMSGNEKTRACSHCEMNVNDISMMTETKAWDLIDESNGNLCVRYEAHPVTNAPIFANMLYQITRQTGVTAGVLGATLAVSAVANAQKTPENNQGKPPATITSVKNNSSTKTTKPPIPKPTPIRPKIMGRIAIRRMPKNPLTIAVQQGSNLKVRLMIARGIDVNEIDTRYYSRSALHIAVEQNNLKMVNMLLNAGADVNLRDQYQNTPLMIVRYNTSAEIVRIIASYGADLNARNRSGQTALFEAVRYNNLEAAKALIESGADVQVKDDFGNSALNFSGSEPIKLLLIAYGAELKTQTN